MFYTPGWASVAVACPAADQCVAAVTDRSFLLMVAGYLCALATGLSHAPSQNEGGLLPGTRPLVICAGGECGVLYHNACVADAKAARMHGRQRQNNRFFSRDGIAQRAAV